MPAGHPDGKGKWEIINLVWEFRVCQDICGDGSHVSSCYGYPEKGRKERREEKGWEGVEGS